MAQQANGSGKPLRFILDGNFNLDVTKDPWPVFFHAENVECSATSDLPWLNEKVWAHEADMIFLPSDDYARLLRTGDRFYKGAFMAVSKITGLPMVDSLLVVGKDDPAQGLADLRGARFGYINASCSTSYFAPAILLNRMGQSLDFLEMVPVKAWQGQVDALAAGEVRATMVPEDVWTAQEGNAGTTRIIGRLETTRPPVLAVRDGLDEGFFGRFRDRLLNWLPEWDKVYGGFKPFYAADLQNCLHRLGQLPEGF